MKKLTLAAIAAATLSVAPAFAADMPVKAARAAAPPAWDLAFGSALASDYIFRGITQSAHRPSVAAYFEPRYNINKDLQLYAGIGAASISFPNRAAAEVDFYAGVRPTFGKLALDFGAWYYYYPGGQQFNGFTGAQPCTTTDGATFCNTMKGNVSFVELYAKGNYSVTDALALGFNFYYSPSFLNSGADGEYLSGTVKYTWPAMANGVTPYFSGEFGRQWFGTTDSFYGLGPGTIFPNGIPYKDYNTWNVGVGWSYKVFTVDLRYTDTNLGKGDCNAFTGDHTANPGTAVTPINPSGATSNWCGARFVARLSADLTVNTNVK